MDIYFQFFFSGYEILYLTLSRSPLNNFFFGNVEVNKTFLIHLLEESRGTNSWNSWVSV
jgi:hypothetical protein